MKKLFKIVIWSVTSLLILFLVLVIYLYFHYNTLCRHLDRIESSLKPGNGKVILGGNGKLRDGQLNLVPVPQKIRILNGSFALPASVTFSSPDSLNSIISGYLSEIDGIKPSSGRKNPVLKFTYKKGLPDQGYNMEVNGSGISVEFSTRQGLFYSIMTIKVLNTNYKSKIPCVAIEDFPDLPVRGMMLDISRNKVPSRETLLRLASILSDLKYNHMELYVEGFSFAYPSFRDLWEKTETPVTGDDIKALDKFCRDHFIDLVPNQNMFGHMMAWLETGRFRDLAECPDGYKLMGLINMKGTLDPSDPGSLRLVTRMADDLLPNFTSTNFNVNMDETFDLGKGKSRKLCEEKGEGNVYFDYALKVHDTLAPRNRKMMMWGDIILRHPEIIRRIPKDITLLDWGYETSYPFEKNARNFHDAGVSFFVCPGTSSWSSFVGRSDNMIVNIRDAVAAGVKYGARGMLLTDWGDMGHWQYQPVSYAGYTAGAALSWNSRSGDIMPLEPFMSSYLFRDEAGIMGRLAYRLGEYSRYEEKPAMSMTYSMLIFQTGLGDRVLANTVYEKMIESVSSLMMLSIPEFVNTFKEKVSNRPAFNFPGMYSLIDSAGILLGNVRMKGPDSLLIKDEYRNALRLLRLSTDLQFFVMKRDSLPEVKQKELLTGMKENCIKYLDENKRLWALRDKPGGYESSVAMLEKLMNDVNKHLVQLEKSSVPRKFDRLIEKLTASAASVYISIAR
ncbi:MAG TPA: glycoside hydrolase family 20 zincin-like fold domain-containing protein [Bacteroidales bacterium]|nr:glycoside hydrolase family 20 zincin-like fold domain-containing protein [Bacteroidales bacterium]